MRELGLARGHEGVMGEPSDVALWQSAAAWPSVEAAFDGRQKVVVLVPVER